MTDSLRQDATDKAAADLKPDSQKTTAEKAQEQVKGAADSVAATLQPSGDKSATQAASDAVTGTGSEGKGVVQQAQEALGNAAETVKDTLGMNQGSTSTSTEQK